MEDSCLGDLLCAAEWRQLSGGGSFRNRHIKSHVVYGRGLVSLCDLSLEMEGMWEEGSSSNKAVEIGDAGYTTVTGHLQAGM